MKGLKSIMAVFKVNRFEVEKTPEPVMKEIIKKKLAVGLLEAIEQAIDYNNIGVICAHYHNSFEYSIRLNLVEDTRLQELEQAEQELRDLKNSSRRWKVKP